MATGSSAATDGSQARPLGSSGGPSHVNGSPFLHPGVTGTARERIPTIIISCIGLLGFPLGTLINAYILVKVCGKQGQFVMTPEYHRIIEVTPHVKRKTSIAAMVLLAILIILLIGIIAAVVIK